MKASIVLVFATILLFVSGCSQPGAVTEYSQITDASLGEPSRDGVVTDQRTRSFDPVDFTTSVNNPYFTLVPGTTFVYEATTEDGVERIEVHVTDRTRMVMGIENRVVWDRVWLNGELIEDTYDWFSQDTEGNVWYFGEDTAELIDGQIVNHNGAWEAGVDGAVPGIVMLAHPRVGDSYWQEYLLGTAEDRADVIALDERVSVQYGSLSRCIQTKDYNPLSPGPVEHKYYCPDVGFVALEVELEDGERVELVSIEHGQEPSPTSAVPAPLTTKITSEQAESIALAEVPGTVTDVAVERKFGVPAFVVEVRSSNGVETDVIIDVDTGEILGVET